MHITWRLKPSLVNLRCGEMLVAFKRASKLAQRKGLGIVHFSLQGNHLHLIVEVHRPDSLARGMKSFGGSFGKAIRRAAGGRGPVFADRFHLQILTNPTQTKRALAYVLQNTSKHAKLVPHLDAYSSAPYFADWRSLLGRKAGPILLESTSSRRGFHTVANVDFLSSPRTWLARDGWKRGVT